MFFFRSLDTFRGMTIGLMIFVNDGGEARLLKFLFIFFLTFHSPLKKKLKLVNAKYFLFTSFITKYLCQPTDLKKIFFSQTTFETDC